MSTREQILIVDDQENNRLVVEDHLRKLRCDIHGASSGEEALEMLSAIKPDCILMDIMMPGMDGIEVLRQLREKSGVPVLMLTAMGEESDRIAGLEIGADDYLPKTFSTRELLARLRAVIRRSRRTEADARKDDEELLVGDLRLEEGSHVASRGGEVLDLTALEFAILGSLMRAGGKVKSREELIEEVSQRKFDVFDRSIDVHISALRRKLGDDAKDPKYIRTIRAVGYQLIGEGRECV